MDFKAASDYLDGLVSYERGRDFSINDFDLKRVEQGLDKFCDGWRNLKCIHVAGSKGKGSVCHLLNKYFVQEREGVGLFTSPHVVSICERININGEDVSEDVFSGLVEKFEESGIDNLTYFEVLFVMAMRAFLDAGVEYVILEVGLGGRLDATNVVTPIVSVLNRVELEHCDILGDTLEAVLGEKMGIKKAGVEMVVGYQSEEVYEMLRKRDELIFVEDKIGKCSDFKEGNYNLVVMVLEKIFGSVDISVFSSVIENFQLLGRFDVREVDGKWIVFDMAHTVSSIEGLIKQLRFYFGNFDVKFLVSLMKDKNKEGILGQLENVGEVNFVDCGVERGVKAEEGCFEGYERLIAGLKKDQVLVVTGSVYLVGKILKRYF